MTVDYAVFVQRAGVSLAVVGATPVLPVTPGETGDGRSSSWTSGWDQILLDATPGSNTLYAFTSGDEAEPSEIETRLDALTHQLSRSGAGPLWTGRGPSVRLIAVIGLTGSPSVGRRRTLMKVGPRAYYAGLRPSTWVVDLETSQVFVPGGLPFGARRSPAVDLLRKAADVRSTGSFDEESARTLRAQHEEQTAAFYQLVRGRQPVVTYSLIALNVIVYLFLTGQGYSESASNGTEILLRYGALTAHAVRNGEWWRLITVMFLHGSVQHILFNMTSLLAVGTLAERLYGSQKFLLVYFGAGVIGAVTSVIWFSISGSLDVPAVGASGAIFGVAGAVMTVRFQPSAVVPASLRQRITASMVPLTLISLPISFILSPHVDNSAHVGGLVGGIVLSLILGLDR